MINYQPEKEAILQELERIEKQYLDVFSSIEEAYINKIPFDGSWTPVQLMEHVTLSVKSVGYAIEGGGEITTRNPVERKDEFEKIFLDYSLKFQSPEMIVPGNEPLPRKEAVRGLTGAFEKFRQVANNHDETVKEIKGLPLGDATMLELMYFTQYHSTRHLDQLINIARHFRPYSQSTA